MDCLAVGRKTGAEAEKLLGLVRFSELSEGLLFAEIAPTHDVLPLMAGISRDGSPVSHGPSMTRAGIVPCTGTGRSCFWQRCRNGCRSCRTAERRRPCGVCGRPIMTILPCRNGRIRYCGGPICRRNTGGI